MMFNIIVALSAFAALVAAVPLNKRQDMAVSTTTEIVIDTIWTTTTIWVPPGASTLNNNDIATFSIPSPSSAPPPPPPTTTSTPAPAAPAPTTPSSYIPPATTNDPPPPATTAPAPYVPPAPANPAPVSPPPSDSTQGQFTGDITFYDVSVGLGSCGWQGSNSDNLVALAAGMMQNGANPNNNPLCGKKINIYYGGSVHQGTIYDTCPDPECVGGSLDLTQSLFNLVAPNGDGRVHGVTWSWA